ncbi:MAG: minor capsid protein [Bifidobacterium aquikefiri]|uniref:Uncharacterized protein n=1 Tax=Bifidobacterium aquikefiri TaxID=1653207 RepID=A0A261G274_9BIFI|nr:minor capsid protein [Bifidobacterium aquikefiri]OZG65544.1 hypothetical protein BAQU_1727 [Bifidobacterium aquikefiri]
MAYNPTGLLLTGIARLLDLKQVGVYRSDAPYVASDTAIIMKTMPDSPDRCIVLNYLPMLAIPDQAHNSGLLQVACRGMPGIPLDSDNLADACDQWLDGLTQYQLGEDCTLNQCYMRNGVNLGQDEVERWITTIQYNVDVDTPQTALRNQ